MAKLKSIVREFDDNIECFSRFTFKLEGLVSEIIAAADIRAHSVTSRTKDRASFLRKLRGRAEKYARLTDMTDICGIRIITYFEDDVDKVASAIENEFDIDRANSVDKRALLDPDRFGYLSLHYVVSLPSRRADLLEYRRFAGFKAEIQVRSILQHAWAEIEHDLGYKTALGVPQSIRREFSRLAGLLEIADVQFSGIRDRLAAYENDVIESIRNRPESVLIDKASLIALTQNDDTINNLDREIGRTVGVPIDPIEDDAIEWYASKLQVVGIETVGELLEALRDRAQMIVSYARERAADLPSWHGPLIALGGAVSLMYLILIRAVESPDESAIRDVLSSTWGGGETTDEKIEEVRRIVKCARGSAG